MKSMPRTCPTDGTAKEMDGGHGSGIQPMENKSFYNKRMKTLLFLCLLCTLPRVVSAQELTLEQKAARMLIVGVQGTSLTADNPVIRDVRERGVAGVILFGKNILPAAPGISPKDTLTRFCHDLQALTNRELIISIDQEGGRVNRLKESLGFPRSVSQHYLGGIDREDTTRLYAARTARTLHETGFNVNFAPCVDLNINPACPVIGALERSFSPHPELVTRHAAYVVDEHRKRGVLTALKHFPGHGSSANDSHLGFTDVTGSWQAKEVIPYQRLIRQGKCDMVMISHVYNAKVDSLYPATLSEAWIDGILRKKLNWDGVVVTDDLHMKAITAHYTLEETLERAINAGADLLIFSSNLGAYKNQDMTGELIDTIVRLVRKGKISEQRLDESAARTQRLLPR